MLYDFCRAMSTTSSSSTDREVAATPKKYRVYPTRWFVLLAVCLLALSNATQWIGYLPITKTTDAFFCGLVDEKAPDSCKIGYYSNQIFQFVSMATGIAGMYITDKYGIRVSIMCGTAFNALGAVIRFAASFPDMPLHARHYILHTGSVIAAAANPFFLVLSPKVAEYWFPERQRALANVLSFIANPLGVALGSVIPTLLVSEAHASKNSYDMLKLNSIFLGLALFVFLLSLCIRHSSPPTPPSPSGAHHGAFSLRQGLKTIFRTPSFLILAIPFGLAFATNWAVFIVTDNILGDLGYGEISGYTTAVAAVAGVLASIAAGVIVDRTKAFKEVIQICFLGIVLTTILLDVLLHTTSHGGTLQTVALVALFVCLGAFCIPVFPIGIEMGVETTFPVAEATSSGVLVVIACVLLLRM